MSPKVRVANEIGRLRRVLVHTPGKEVTAVTPSTRKEFLYDDIISLEAAAEEHRRFTSILRRFAQVDEFIDVLSETLDIPEARKFLIDRSEEITACVSLRKKIEELSSREIAHLYIEGWRTEPGPFATALEAQSYVLPPLPNLYFMRDASFVLGNHPVISATRFTARWPEEALMRTLFGFHPELGSQPILYDGSVERRHDYTIEGGDIHPVSPDTVVVGLSERTSVSALDVLSKRLFEETEVTEIIAVMIPEHSPAIHLDMVWTQV
ncbi:hypothetical protein KAI87_06945, partial [Myxococcota bacterium]|nr:hypothetical protein [Myxococcota bacterium]